VKRKNFCNNEKILKKITSYNIYLLKKIIKASPLPSTTYQNLCPSLRQLFSLTLSHGLVITAAHVPGVSNQTMDSLSRLEIAKHYQICPMIFWNTIKDSKGLSERRLICNRNESSNNFLLQCQGDEDQSERMALEEKTKRRSSYKLDGDDPSFPLHPPIPLIQKTLQKFQQECSLGIIILPDWKGRIWSPLLQHLTMRKIILG
jgi:hypothetical protein